MIARIRGVVGHPVRSLHRLRGWERQVPRHATRTRALGLDGVHLVLSFDCDTTDDASVVLAMHERLSAMGARPVYAVAGDHLRRSPEIYGQIGSSGAQFINHGGKAHTYFDAGLGRHASCFFYGELEEAAIRADMESGDLAIREVIGVSPTGWRTPHFGTFERRRQLALVHRRAAELGYAFSTSTTPLWGLRRGPAFRRHGIWELPVSGMPSDPFAVLDTWSCFAAPDRSRGPEDFEREGNELADSLAAAGAGIINVYGDPLHIHDSEPFFRTVERWLEVARACNYDELLRLIR